MPLTDTKIKNARSQEKPYILQDGQGLYLEIRPSGAKFWRYRFWLTPTKDGRYTIGEYPSVSLSEARKEREWAREQVKMGHNPTDIRKRQKQQNVAEAANTFKLVAEEWIERKSHTWKPATKEQVESFLATNAYPAFGHKPIRDVTAHEILAVLRGMEKRGSVSSALKVRQWCSAIFCFAVATLRADSDPAAALKGAVIPKRVTHARALGDDEITDLYQRIEHYRGFTATKVILKLLPYVFSRQVELRSAEWSEINLEEAIWIIPGEKMKMGRTHSVPLCQTAIDLIKQLQPLTGKGKYLFPNVKNPGDVMSESTINRAFEYMGYPRKHITSHDFRATASTKLHEKGFRHEVIERQLAHAEEDRTSAAYNHAEYLPERRAMMEFWEGFINSLRTGAA